MDKNGFLHVDWKQLAEKPFSILLRNKAILNLAIADFDGQVVYQKGSVGSDELLTISSLLAGIVLASKRISREISPLKPILNKNEGWELHHRCPSRPSRGGGPPFSEPCSVDCGHASPRRRQGSSAIQRVQSAGGLEPAGPELGTDRKHLLHP